MSYFYAHGVIQWLAADAATTTYGVTCTDVNGGGTFQPTAIRFSHVGIHSATDAASEALSIRRGMGFCTSTSVRRCVGSFSEDAVATTDCSSSFQTDAVAVVTDNAAAIDGLLDVSAFNSDGFTAIVDNQVSVNISVFWEAWGGTELTVATCGSIAEPAATGDVDYTVTGFSGTAPAGTQVVMFAGVQSTAAAGTPAAESSGFMIGYSTGASGQNIVLTGAQDHASASADTCGYAKGDECLAQMALAGGNSVSARASLTQFGTDNFRLNWAERATTNRRYIFMAIRGGQWRAGDYTIDSLTLNATATVSGLPFTPVGISLMGRRLAEDASDTGTTNDRMGWGCGSSTSSRRSMSCLDEQGADPTQTNLGIDYDSVLSFVDNAGAVSSAYDISAMSADGFTIIVDAAGSSATEWQGYLAFGSINLNRAPDVGTTVCAGLQPTISVEGPASPITIEPGAGTAAFVGLAPAAFYSVTEEMSVGAAVIAGLAPVASYSVTAAMSAGTLVVNGLAPATFYSVTMEMSAGTLAVTGLAPLSTAVISVGAGTATFTGLAPAFTTGFLVEPPAGAAIISGLAPLSTVVISVPAGAITVTGEVLNFVAGALIQLPTTTNVAITGIAPNVIVPTTIAIGAGSAVFAGLTPTVQVVANIGGGGGPGLLFALNLNIEISNFTFGPANYEAQFVGLVPAWGAGYSYSLPAGAVTTLGYAPSVTTAQGDQVPVMDAPVALAITGQVPTVIHGHVVRFPFLSDTEGFVGTPGDLTAMVWFFSGNPGGSLSTRTNGNNTVANNVWTLTTDWISLGVPENATVTAVSLATIDSRCSEYTNGSVSDQGAVILTPTGFSPIQLAAARTISGFELSYVQSAGAGAVGLEIPSNGSLTIEIPSILRTGPTGTTAVRLQHDNLTFVVSYTLAETIAPDVGTVVATGYAPTVTGLAAVFAQPGAGSMMFEGAGPMPQVTAGVSGGGGGPGLLLGIALNLEQTPLGAANLVITGYAPTVVRPISASGSDDLFSERATMVGTGNKIGVGASTIETPGVKALAITGLAPTLVETGTRIVSPPAGAITVTYFVPTLGVDHVRAIGLGLLNITGFGPAFGGETVLTSPTGAATFTGYEPLSLVSVAVETGVGAITITGYEPGLGFDVTFTPDAAALAIVGEVVDVIGVKTWDGSGILQSQRAFISAASGTITRTGSGDLQSQQPLGFTGSGTRNSTTTSDMHSGPAGLHGGIIHAGPIVLLHSERATLKSKARFIPFKPHKRPKPQRVNRYTVQLKPSKRKRVGKPNRRKPWK